MIAPEDELDEEELDDELGDEELEDEELEDEELEEELEDDELLEEDPPGVSFEPPHAANARAVDSNNPVSKFLVMV